MVLIPSHVWPRQRARRDRIETTPLLVALLTAGFRARFADIERIVRARPADVAAVVFAFFFAGARRGDVVVVVDVGFGLVVVARAHAPPVTRRRRAQTAT